MLCLPRKGAVARVTGHQVEKACTLLSCSSGGVPRSPAPRCFQMLLAPPHPKVHGALVRFARLVPLTAPLAAAGRLCRLGVPGLPALPHPGPSAACSACSFWLSCASAAGAARLRRAGVHREPGAAQEARSAGGHRRAAGLVTATPRPLRRGAWARTASRKRSSVATSDQPSHSCALLAGAIALLAWRLPLQLGAWAEGARDAAGAGMAGGWLVAWPMGGSALVGPISAMVT